jgi:Flp pilus assembly protein TadB
MQKNQTENSSKIEAFITTTIAAFFAMIVVAAVFLLRSVALPILRFCVRSALNGMKKGSTAALANVPSIKRAKARASLPTPDVFKGASNLGPAKQMRF